MKNIFVIIDVTIYNWINGYVDKENSWVTLYKSNGGQHDRY